MKGLNHISKLLLVLLFITSCNTDFLDTKPLDSVSEVDAWSDPVLAEAIVNYAYDGIPLPTWRGKLTAMIVDEADYRGKGHALNFNNCLITVDNNQSWGGLVYKIEWDDLYKSVRNCNIFFANVDKIQFEDSPEGQALRNRMTGEVHFIRAFLYYLLTSQIGGVPIIAEAYTLNDEFIVPRDTYEDCIEFIVSDCEAAADLLPEEYTGDGIGRATKGAALLLKSRVLLYAASDLHNKVSQIFPGYSNPELIGYTSGSQQDRWQRAKNAAEDVMKLGIYDLVNVKGASVAETAANYQNYFITNSMTSEDIFLRFQNPSPIGHSRYNLSLYSGPNGYYNWGENAPIGDFVDKFEMIDGTKFDWNNPVHAAAPYDNRDPRFYANVLYEGAKWRERPDDVKDLDPVGVIQVGSWQKWDETTQSVVETFGLDNRQGPVQQWNGSFTGYYLRKFMDPTVNAEYEKPAHPWRFFRYTEVFLNYAEACIELAEDVEARKYINMIRDRVGMPEITESGEALRQRYRLERDIELCFEEHRFWDVRRWVIGPEAYHPVTAVKVVYELQPDHTTATVPTYTPIVFQQRSWIDKAYYLPIMREEISRNELLIQNPGY